MALASLDDVKRILRLTDDDADRDAQIQAALDAVESWAETKLCGLGRTGAQSWTFFDVDEDVTLHLPDRDATVTLVEVFEYPGTSGFPAAGGTELSPVELGVGAGYDLTDDGSVILRPILVYQPFEGATATRAVQTYARVTVHYQASGQVPRAVTEGVAYLAAGYWKAGPTALEAIKREKIGNYEYETQGGSSGEDPPYLAQGMWFLKDYMPKQRVQVC